MLLLYLKPIIFKEKIRGIINYNKIITIIKISYISLIILIL